MADKPRWTAGNHPTPEELLLAREDQLSRDEAEPVLAHIHQCWQCRSHVERFTRGIDAYLKLREAHLDPAVTPRPGGWLRLSARLRDDASHQVPSRQSFWKRVPTRVWLAASAMAAAVLLAALIISPAPLTATAVLDRAVNAESAGKGSSSVERVRVHRGGQLVSTDDIVLRKARIDRARPLSVASFRAWHDALESRQDSVAAIENEIRVETKTPIGAISLASLTVARADYLPHAKHVELRDGITIDVEAVGDATPEPSPETSSATGVRESPATKPVLTAKEREALEMEVRWALHRIDADLGEPLEIRAAGEALLVRGTLDDAARRDQIAEALHGMPQVLTQLGVAVPDADLLGKSQPIEPGASAAGPLLIPQLLKDLPDSETRRAFVSQALRLSHDILRHSWALRRLAERYPHSAAGSLDATTRVSLQQLVAAHQEAIGYAIREAAALWKPYVQFDTSIVNSRTAWQAASLTTLDGAQRFDHLTARLLAAGGNDGLDAAEALRQLHENFRRLQ